MKQIKKWIALTITLVMVLMIQLPAMAATITITGGAANSTYNAYKLFSVTHSSTGTDGESHYAYEIENDTQRTIILAGLNESLPVDWDSKSAEEKDAFDKKLVMNVEALDTAGIRKFADQAYRAILVDTTIKATGTSTADTSTSNAVFSDLDAGYYLIAETTPGNNQDSYSLTMLATTYDENKSISTKESYPKVTKKVQEKNDSNKNATNNGSYQSAADYDIGDTISFHLTGTLPSNYENYTTYRYVFHDTLGEGLTYNDNTVQVYYATTNYQYYTNITNKFTISSSNEELTISCDDLKKCTSSLETFSTDGFIMVDYTATLNENAVIGTDGNLNTVKLEYSRNPYGTETGTSVESKVTVYTYSLTVNKTDNEGNVLTGAAFTLSKLTNTEDTSNQYKKVTTIASTTESPLSTFEFKGLDAGTYKLEETTIPDGYHGADPIIFTITAEYGTSAENQKLTSVTTDKTETISFSEIGKLTTTVQNFTGKLMPTTGGIGTTIFLVVGAFLVIGSITLLITRRKMNREE